jgi:hypothetical protein
MMLLAKAGSFVCKVAISDWQLAVDSQQITNAGS